MSKTFKQIPRNRDVMLDANVVIYALFSQMKYHESSKHLLERGARGDVKLHLVVSAVADVIHRAMVLELMAQGKFEKSGEAVNHLKQNQDVIPSLNRHKDILADLVEANVNILPLTYQDLHASKQYRNNYGLMVNDSLIVAVMNREKIQYLATNDTDFEHIPNIAVRVPY